MTGAWIGASWKSSFRPGATDLCTFAVVFFGIPTGSGSGSSNLGCWTGGGFCASCAKVSTCIDLRSAGAGGEFGEAV